MDMISKLLIFMITILGILYAIFNYTEKQDPKNNTTVRIVSTIFFIVYMIYLFYSIKNHRIYVCIINLFIMALAGTILMIILLLDDYNNKPLSNDDRIRYNAQLDLCFILQALFAAVCLNF